MFGSRPLATVGCRKANDADHYASEGVLRSLIGLVWRQVSKGSGDAHYANGVFEAHANWDFSPYSPTLKHLLDTAIFVGGIPFASLKKVRSLTG